MSWQGRTLVWRIAERSVEMLGPRGVRNSTGLSV
jgi:hypothetical protein